MQALSRWQPWRLRHLPTVNGFAARNRRSSPPRVLRLDGRCFQSSQSNAAQIEDLLVADEIKERVEELQLAGIDPYPRRGIKYIPSSLQKLDRVYSKLILNDQTLQRGQTKEDVPLRSYRGRIESVRTAGRLLFFVDIVRKGLRLQILVNHMEMLDAITEDEFIARRKLLRRGDIVAIAGYPYRAQSGQLSLRARELPCLLSPCLHKFPLQKSLEDASSDNEAHFLDKHVEMLVNHTTAPFLLRRSQIIRQIRNFLNRGGFVEVQTPILSARAGGAIARPFETFASEFPEKQLSLRIAPELWLKKLIVGGLDRIFEIGPCFRNEGLDKTHNPEFTTCEFYSVYSSIGDLLRLTEVMLNTIVRNIQSVPAAHKEDVNRLPRTRIPPLALPARFFKGPYPQIDFLPALNEALDLKLPDLTAESALPELIRVFREKDISLPALLTLPRLLDKLSSTYLEPKCDEPTWIINYPECVSPLSKSFMHPSPDVAQPVAARAELFIHGREIVNCYEEENSPFEQRRKFMMQQKYSAVLDDKTPDPEAMTMDEDYLKALEWGLPPTGGWGCGIDRLVMLLTDKQRINDVLTFGNLRSVTRMPERRKLVNLPKLPAIKLNQQDSQMRTQENVRRQVIDSDGDRSFESQLDAAEEAIRKIKKELNKGKINRSSKPSNTERSGPTAQQEQLANWLAGGETPDPDKKA